MIIFFHPQGSRYFVHESDLISILKKRIDELKNDLEHRLNMPSCPKSNKEFVIKTLQFNQELLKICEQKIISSSIRRY